MLLADTRFVLRLIDYWKSKGIFMQAQFSKKPNPLTSSSLMSASYMANILLYMPSSMSMG